jgi:hypothetical protein
MKRYLLFAHDQYYPCGGWGDFKSSFDSLEEAFAYGRQKDINGHKRYDWCHVVDTETWTAEYDYDQPGE